jgi:DNA polymerase
MDQSKAILLRELEKALIEDITLPLRQSNLVFGEGNIDCEIMFVGEAPGVNEDRERRPFVGRGGQLLRKNVRAIGWKEEDVYITNIVKRRPPENRDPLPEEIEAYKPYLTRQIEIINPPIIVTLGRFSMNYFLPEAKITRDQGKVFRLAERVIIPFFHPAAALRATNVLKQFEEGFTRLPTIIKKIKELPPQATPTQASRTIPSNPEPPQSTLF